MIQAPQKHKRPPGTPWYTATNPEGSTFTGFGDSAVKPAKDEHRQAWTLLLYGMVTIVAIAVVYRLYQQAFAWSKGTDAASSDFAHYWMSLMVIRSEEHTSELQSRL